MPNVVKQGTTLI